MVPMRQILPCKRAERGTDLDTEIFDEPAPHSELVDALGDDDRRQEGKSVLARLLAEERQPQRVEAGAQRVAVPAMSREARLEALPCATARSASRSP